MRRVWQGNLWPRAATRLKGYFCLARGAEQRISRIIDGANSVTVERTLDGTLAPLFKELWIAMHKPIYASSRIKDGVNEGDNKTLAEAARGAIPPNPRVLLSGHMHAFQGIDYVQDFPAQVVAGTGGDALEAYAPRRLNGLALGGAAVDKGIGVTGVFGFALLERGVGEWSLIEFDTPGKPLALCHRRGRKIACD